MPFVLRQAKDEDNPRLPDAYGKQITAGRLVYYEFDAALQRTKFILFLCRGGKYGCDGIEKFYYAGEELPEFTGGARNWRFHPGQVTGQIIPQTFTADAATDTITCAAHGYADGTLARVRSIGGTVPEGLTAETVKYEVTDSSTNTFKLKLPGTSDPSDLATNGSGALLIWKADAGVDDPEQGAPEFVPHIPYTFSGICYVEGLLPQNFSEAGTEPDRFKIVLKCRRVADYNAQGVAQNPPAFTANNARVAADILLNELKLAPERIDWPSWHALKSACDQMIWYRANTTTQTGTGLVGRYYNHPALPVANESVPEFTNEGVTLVKTRVDETIDFNWQGNSPAPGVNADWFLVRWEGQVKPQYSETYTFKLIADNGVRLWINNQQIINRWTNAYSTESQPDTGQIALTANQPVNIKLEYFEAWGLQNIRLLWSSASLTEQIAPKARLYQADREVKRYEAHLAIPAALTAWQAFEAVMDRAPGWDWQDVNGKIKFLPPDREAAHHFNYDPDVLNERVNIAGKTFEAAPRPAEERPNYQRFEFRDVEEETLAQSYIESHRAELREAQGGQPSDTQLIRVGVMSRSLAERIAETRMRLLTDPERQFTLRGQLDSYPVSKGDRVLLSHFAGGDTHHTPVECLVTAEITGGAADEKTYTLLPVSFPFYEDEAVE
jgi:hypothetical protein